MNSMIKTPCLATDLSKPLCWVEDYLLSHQENIEQWFAQQWLKTQPPIYCSVDLRNAGYKLSAVDTNLFPAGFNNLNSDFMPAYVKAAQAAMKEICPSINRLLIIPESHTRNIFYLESLSILQEIFQQAGFETRIASAEPHVLKPDRYQLPSGKTLFIEELIKKDQQVGVKDFFSCCIILNNDLSNGILDILKDTPQKIMPPVRLGWSTRLKSDHFRFYREVTEEFSQFIHCDPWALMPLFDQCPEVDFMKQAGEKCLMEMAEHLLNAIRLKYQEYGIKQTPFLVIKADQGTYGMAVMMIRDPQELAQLNRKQRTRMSTIKGGKRVTKAIIQEGIYTIEKNKDNQVAEPVIYMLGQQVIGGFYRVHKERGDAENLNAPGMNFSPLTFKDPNTQRFYVYGVVARLALVAAARELAALKKENHE